MVSWWSSGDLLGFLLFLFLGRAGTGGPGGPGPAGRTCRRGPSPGGRLDVLVVAVVVIVVVMIMVVLVLNNVYSCSAISPAY